MNLWVISTKLDIRLSGEQAGVVAHFLQLSLHLPHLGGGYSIFISFYYFIPLFPFLHTSSLIFVHIERGPG